MGCLTLLGATPHSSQAASYTTVSGYIGSHRLSFRAAVVSRQTEFVVRGPADYLAVTEVYPDTPERLEYRYRITAPGLGEFVRTHTSEGFGPLTFFVRVRRGTVGTVRISPLSLCKPPLIASVRGVTEEELRSILANDRFLLMGLIPHGAPESRSSWADVLAAKLPSRPDMNITRGFSAEIRYANCAPQDVREQLRTCMAWSIKHNMPAMLGLVSWWSGTPLRVPDGRGGTFGDLQYQQVCYSPDFEHDDDPRLAAMLGERYNRHYGLSVPNQWSSTPWLTMNSPALNRYRYLRLDEAVETLSELSKKSASWIGCIYLENEPRYWDTACEAGNPKAGRQGKELWADFNPLVVGAARRDGVGLDPSDGLSNEELSWLHRNVGAYNQDMVDAFRLSLSKRKFGRDIPVYTHSLQHRDMFPGGPINHPASEWAYADGAWTGIEGMWSLPSDFTRLREWGPWSNLNREENDGQHIDWHLWDLRVAYMMGASLYNSYNWHAIGADRFFDYVKEFVTQLPVVTLPPAEARMTDDLRAQIKLPMKLQAFSRIELPVEVSAGQTSAGLLKGTAWLQVESPTGGVFRSDSRGLNLKPGSRRLAFDFATPAEAKWNEVMSVSLHVSDAAGDPVGPEAIRLQSLSADGVKLSLDLRTQRALSLAIIRRNRR